MLPFIWLFTYWILVDYRCKFTERIWREMWGKANLSVHISTREVCILITNTFPLNRDYSSWMFQNKEFSLSKVDAVYFKLLYELEVVVQVFCMEGRNAKFHVLLQTLTFYTVSRDLLQRCYDTNRLIFDRCHWSMVKCDESKSIDISYHTPVRWCIVDWE